MERKMVGTRSLFAIRPDGSHNFIIFNKTRPETKTPSVMMMNDEVHNNTQHDITFHKYNMKLLEIGLHYFTFGSFGLWFSVTLPRPALLKPSLPPSCVFPFASPQPQQERELGVSSTPVLCLMSCHHRWVPRGSSSLNVSSVNVQQSNSQATGTCTCEDPIKHQVFRMCKYTMTLWQYVYCTLCLIFDVTPCLVPHYWCPCVKHVWGFGTVDVT